MSDALLHLDPADRELVEVASRLVAERSDGVRHTVAAALRTEAGDVVTGLNLYHFTGGPCAEIVAMANAAAAGARVVTVTAVGSNGRGVLAPCGRCRQVLADLWPAARVVVPDGEGVRVLDVQSLLPYAYRTATQNGLRPAR